MAEVGLAVRLEIEIAVFVSKDGRTTMAQIIEGHMVFIEHLTATT